ncbi:hypothetical protein U1Q18_020994 [Sarracenia purpurea var. burkii]
MEPIYDVGRELKNPMTNPGMGGTHSPDPTNESLAQFSNVLSHESVKALPIRVANWKRRAREAHSDLVLGSVNGDGKKRKKGIKESKQNDEELEEVAVRKKG